MPGGLLLRAGVLMLMAPAGMLAGHGFAYMLAIPDTAHRAEVLADSGHGWWPAALPVAAVLLAGGLALALLPRSEDGSARRARRRDVARWIAPRLAASQLGLFAVVEICERFAAGHPVHHLHAHGLVEHGAVAQVLVALALTGLCWCLALALDLACVPGAPTAPPPVPEPARPAGLGRSATPLLPRSAHGARAPPAYAR